MRQLRSMRTATKSKYFKCIEDCANAGTFDIRVMRAKHNVGTVIFQAMLESKCITRNNNQSKWIAGPLNEQLLNTIYACYESISRKYNAAELLRKNNIDPKTIVAKPQQPIAQPSPVINPSPIEKAHVTTTQHAEINVDDRALRNAFITGFVIGVLISCAIAAMW